MAPIQNKVGAFVADSAQSDIDRARKTLHIRRIIDRGQVLW
jgi:hypothetical protein